MLKLSGPSHLLRSDFLAAYNPQLEARYSYCLAGDDGPLNWDESKRGLHHGCELAYAKKIRGSVADQ